MAVIGSGLMTGNYSTKWAMSPTTRVSVSDFWEYAAFMVNSVLFLMIGIEVKIVDFVPLWIAVLLAVAGMLCGRAAAVFLTAPVIGRVDKAISGRWQTVLFWGGIRGAICMVLALSLPRDLPLRQFLITMIFSVVIFTLLVQGLSIKTVLKKLGIIPSTTHEPYEARKGQIYGLGRAQSELEHMYSRGVLSKSNYEILAPRLQHRLKESHQALDEAAARQQEAVSEELHQARKRLLDAEKDGIKEAYLSGIISDKIMKKLLADVDNRFFSLEKAREKHPNSIKPADKDEIH